MKKKLYVALSTMMLIFGIVFSNITPVSATTCDKYFLGFPAWYNGLEMKDCDSAAIDSDYYGRTLGDDGIAILVWTIVLNVMMDISIAVGILTTAFVMYGGYLYIFSEGSPDKVSKGKTTIRNALIGLIIAVAAGVIIGTVKTILTV